MSEILGKAIIDSINKNKQLLETIEQLKAENKKLNSVNLTLENFRAANIILQLKEENAQLKSQLQNYDKCKKCGADIFCHDCMEETMRDAAKRIDWGKNEKCEKMSRVERNPHKCPVCDGKKVN